MTRSNARSLYSKGTFIAFLDSDDPWLSQKSEKQVQVLSEKPCVDLVYTDVQFIDTNGNPYDGKICWDTPKRTVLYKDLMTHNIVTGSTSSAMIKRTCLDKVGLFDESMNACEDLDLYRRIARYYRFCKIDLPLLKCRIHSGNTQHNACAMAAGWEITIGKISREIPQEFEYHKNEAILKILSQIADLYKQAGKLNRFFAFCAKSAFNRPGWILKYAFWRNFARILSEKGTQRL